jgi:hypothetical protein
MGAYAAGEPAEAGLPYGGLLTTCVLTAALLGKLLPVIGLYRADMQARLLATTQARIFFL